MSDTQEKKPMSMREMLTYVAIIGSIVIAKKMALIEAWTIQNFDGIAFIAWVGILVLIYIRLKSMHKEQARERKHLLRLQALRERNQRQGHNDGDGDDDGGGGGGGSSSHAFNSIQSERGPGKPGPALSGAVTASVGATSAAFPTPPPVPLDAPQEIEIGTRLLDGKRIHLSDLRRTGQVQIPGATGRGKTESIILPWLVQDYLRGKSPILIDGKGDPELLAKFFKACEIRHDTQGVFVFDPLNPRSCTINPLGSGTPQQIVDRILSSFQFPDPYYKGIQADALLTAVSLVREFEQDVTFIRIEQALTVMDHLSELANRSTDPRLQAKARALVRQREETRVQNLSGILSQLAPLTTGEIARLVNGKTGGDGTTEGQGAHAREISLVDTMVERPSTRTATLILLPTLVYQDLGKILGRMILQELAYCVGMRAARSGKRFPMTPVFLDEFSSFAYTGFEQILNKARSSGVALHLSHQSMGDLESVSPQFAKIVGTNTNVKCLLGLNDPDTAEFFARHLGTYTTEKYTERTEEQQGLFSSRDEKTGMKSVRETESYKVHPNTLKSMSGGQGVLYVPTEYGPLTEEVQFHDLTSLDLNRLRREAR